MKKNLRILSIAALVVAIPSLIITDWYDKDYGLMVMFAFLTVGLVLDQIIRIKYPPYKAEPFSNYRLNRILNTLALVLFVQAPIGLIYGNKSIPKMGTWLMAVMICGGIILNQIASIKFSYKEGGTIR